MYGSEIHWLRTNSIDVRIRRAISDIDILSSAICEIFNRKSLKGAKSPKELRSDDGVRIYRHAGEWVSIVIEMPIQFIRYILNRHGLFEEKELEWFKHHRGTLYNKAIELFVKDIRCAVEGLKFEDFETLWFLDAGPGIVYGIDDIFGDVVVKCTKEFKQVGPIVDHLVKERNVTYW